MMQCAVCSHQTSRCHQWYSCMCRGVLRRSVSRCLLARWCCVNALKRRIRTIASAANQRTSMNAARAKEGVFVWSCVTMKCRQHITAKPPACPTPSHRAAFLGAPPPDPLPRPPSSTPSSRRCRSLCSRPRSTPIMFRQSGVEIQSRLKHIRNNFRIFALNPFNDFKIR